MKKSIIVFTLSLIILSCCISVISASDTNNNTLTDNHDNILTSTSNNTINNTVKQENNQNLSLSLNQSENPDHYTVNSSNFHDYFDENNNLKPDYGGKVMVFEGEFNDLDTLVIYQDNTVIIGNNSLLKNTAFGLYGENIYLKNLNFQLNKSFSDNKDSCIYVGSDNVTIDNITMDYTVPEGNNGIGIYVGDTGYKNIFKFNLYYSTINLTSTNPDGFYKYGVLVRDTTLGLIYGNKINCRLPLMAVNWAGGIFGGVSMDYVLGFGAEDSKYINFVNNYVNVSATALGQSFPTLDACMFYKCDKAVIKGNKIYEEDLLTKKGTNNYLYGLDIYMTNNVTIANNEIHMKTYGGQDSNGAAYSIQVNGPSSDIKIAYNNLTTINNGPNLGIYSNNYYGAVKLYILSNFINVTGYAGRNNWALVAGIEVQDSDDVILNNTIYAQNVNNNSDIRNNNIYGISYSQSTSGNHQYNIQYNKVITNGYNAVMLDARYGVTNSEIGNNVLITDHSQGDDAVEIKGNTKRYNNQVFNNTGNPDEKQDMPADLVPNDVINAMNNPYTPNTRNFFNTNINGNGTNPFNGNGTGNSTNPFNINGSGNHNGLNGNSSQNGKIHNGNGIINGMTMFNSNGNSIQSHNGSVRTVSNSTNANTGMSSEDLASGSSSSAGDSSKSASKAYAIYKNTNNLKDSNYKLPFGIIAIIIIILIIAGYVYKKDKEE
ncbi:hypothetical protein [Methanobrevibacter boviskoreani]|uniref:hypothetical protein n=1 Tax=Methanobrevibacter boviskoreani TaxID=1348249 RepID=UPI0023A80661|nr:hypothetical protein [Methanobrevibacter boviskoreani]MCI6774430.1 hypothetical protein [Methanobrevibacter boviskoreani]